MYPFKKKSKGLFFFAIILLAVVVGYIYFSNNPLIVQFPNWNLGQNQSSTNNLAQTCLQKVNDCGQVIKSKYDSSVSILTSKETNSTEEANQFLKTWSPASYPSEISSYGVSMPVVLIATRFDNSDGSKTPHVFICQSDGTLESKTTAGFC
jgi:hypothetical protein